LFCLLVDLYYECYNIIMKIRLRAILVIVLTNLMIIIFSVSTGIIFVQKNMDISLETDLTAMSNIANHFLSVELDNLKLKARGAAKSLEQNNETAWPVILREQNISNPVFAGMAVIEPDRGIIAVFGEAADAGILNDKYISKSLSGKFSISSTCRNANGLFFYMAVPLAAPHDGILVITLPGTYFQDQLSKFAIWETGHIFLSDSEGYAISNPRDSWVQDRFNYINDSKTDKIFSGLAETVTRMTQGESGTSRYKVYNIPRLCSFGPVSGSEEGWSLGVVAPLPENPVKNTDSGLLLVAYISLILSVIAAVVASNFIKKPFEKIAILKEEADNANKAKTSFLSTMSHEIRTPMNAILGISEIQLQNKSIDSAVKEAFAKIFTSGDLLLSIINDILDLSKIEAGKFDLNIDKYEVASMISDTTQLNMMRIGGKPIKFELQVDENLPTHLIGDELRIKQILNNLLSNAFKYTDEGNVILSVYAEPVKDDAVKDEVVLVIIVSDSGQGLSKEQVDKLFDAYTQFNKKANSAKEGTGLGMSITYNLINLAKGSINVESEPGKGSTFTVRLPQGKCDCGVLGMDVARNLCQFRMHGRDFMERLEISREPMPYGNVLIVDDVEANIYVAMGLLAFYDIKVSSAKSGPKAIKKIKDGEKFDIIFMDHMMPEMDGIEATRQIRDLGYTAPIIALSANAVEGQAELFIQNGFDDFISKPVDIRQLNQILNRHIRDKQPQDVLDEARRQKAEKMDKIAVLEELKAKPVNLASKSLLAEKEIAGLDIVKGIKRFDGNEQAYMDVLRSYAAGVNSMLDDIETVSKDTLNSYIIKVHGIKGTSFDIYADQIAKAAQYLEKAGKSGDLQFIMSNNQAFIKKARNLVSSIINLFKTLDSENQKPLKDKPDKDVLLRLLNACNEYDMDEADAAMADLEKFKYETDNDLVEWLRQNIVRSEFEQISEKISSLLNA